jgi:hypothetical protein
MTTNLEPSPDLLLVKPRRRLLRRHRVLGRSNEGIGAERRWKVQRVTMSVFCVATSSRAALRDPAFWNLRMRCEFPRNIMQSSQGNVPK